MTEEHDPLPVRSRLEHYCERSALFARPGFLIRRLHQIHTWLFAEETQQYNVTPVQYSLLTVLAEHGEMDQNTLAYEVGLERTSVAEVLPRLEARGLVERRQSEADRRVKLVRIARKGRALAKRMDGAAQRAHDRTIAYLPEAEREHFMLQLIQLVESHNDASAVPWKLR
ncbi:MAG: MarR family transcriptional regulator [Pseudorhodoferax sp.]